jgi:ABC transporter DrrB family efflux protein
VSTDTPEIAIEATGITKSFGDTHALVGVDLVVATGTVQGLLGPNGSGKTTLVKILSTLLAADAGTASVAGVDVRADPTAVRSLIGLAGQFAAVDESLTGRENLVLVGRLYRLGPQLAKQRAEEALERLGLVEAADRQVKTYSGGMRRRLDLGASLVGQPQVLILDEPTTGLDPRTRSDLWQFIRDLVAQGTTVLLTTQYLEEADQLADHIVVIDHGRLIANGTPDELKSRLGADLLELEVAPDELDHTVELLSGIGHATIDSDAERSALSIPVTHSVSDLMTAALLLREAGITPGELGLRRPSLDDVFLSLTGRPVSDEPAPGEPSKAPATPTLISAVQPRGDQLSHPAHRTRLPVSAIATDSLLVAKRNLIRITRTPQLLVFATIQPVMFVLLFRYVFGGAIRVSGSSYVDYLIPGIIVQTVVFGATTTAVGLSQDLSTGIIDRFRSLPMARSAVLAGRTLADLVRNVFVVVLMILVGELVGFRFHNGFLPGLGAVGVALLLGYSLSWAFALVGLTVSDPETAQLAGFLPIFPLVFASSVFTPIASMPGWLQAFAKIQPITRAANTVRALTQGGPIARNLLWTVVWSVGLLTVFATLAVRRYRRG